MAENFDKIYNNDLKLIKELNNPIEDLYITSKFPPSKDVSGLVFSKRIIKANKKVDVVCSDFDDDKDFVFNKIIDNYIDEKIVVDGDYVDNTVEGIHYFRKKGMELLSNSDKKYKRVISRSWTTESHFLALDYKLDNPDVIWIAEFSDPLSFDINNNLRLNRPFFATEEYFDKINEGINQINQDYFGDNHNKYLPNIKENDELFFLSEYLPFLFADVIRFTNDNQKQIMLEQFPYDISEIVSMKTEVMRHPTLDKEYYYLKETNYVIDKSYLNFAYFGTYLDKRHLEYLFKSFEELNDDIKNRIRIHFFVPDSDLIKSNLEHREIFKFINIEETLPFLEFLNLTTNMDVLIVNDLLTEGFFRINPYLPSKLADYIGSGSDIWSICEHNSSLDKIECKYKSYVGDYLSTKEVLSDIIFDKLNITQNKVKISVIIPVYNVESFIGECLDSVLNQTFKDFEVICIDDGSTDGSLKILNEYSSSDSRLTVISQENSGQGHARKVGLDLASGEFILFVDSDDFIELNTLQLLYDNICNNDSDVVLFKLIRYNHINLVKKYNKPVFDFDSIFDEDFNNFTFYYEDVKRYVLNAGFSPVCKFYRKEFLDKYDDFFFASNFRYEDVPLHVQVMLRSKMSFCPYFLYYYRISNSSSSINTSTNKKVMDIFPIIDIVEDILKKEDVFQDFEREFYKFKYDQILAYIFPSKSEDYFLEAKSRLQNLKISFYSHIYNKIQFDALLSSNSYSEFHDNFFTNMKMNFFQLLNDVSFRDKDIKDLNSEILKKEEMINSLNSKIKDNNIRDSELNNLKSENISFRDEINSLNETNLLLEKKFEEVESINSKLKSENISFRGEINSLNETNLLLEKKFEEVENINSQLKSENVNFSNEINSLNDSIVLLEKKCDEAENINFELKSGNLNFRKKINSLNETNLFLEKKFEEVENINSQLKSENVNFSNEVNSLNETNLLLEKKFEEAENINSQLKSENLNLHKKINSLNDSIVLLEKKCDEAENINFNLRSENLNFSNEVNSLNDSIVLLEKKCDEAENINFELRSENLNLHKKINSLNETNLLLEKKCDEIENINLKQKLYFFKQIDTLKWNNKRLEEKQNKNSSLNEVHRDNFSKKIKKHFS